MLKHRRLHSSVGATALLVLLGLAPWQHSCASVQWASTSVERVAAVGQDVVEIAFPFSNSSPHPISIVNTVPSCGCTMATLEKKTYAPGEEGLLLVLFDTKGLSGLQEKTIQVFTDDSSKPQTLTLRVTVPPWLEVTPRLLWWSMGEEGKPKEASLTLSRDTDIRITSVKNDQPSMEVSLLPTEDKKRYRLVAKPATTAAALQATVTLQMEIAGAAPRSYTIFAQVR